MFDYPSARLGIVGTGFVSTGLSLVLKQHHGLTVSRVLTRRPDSKPIAHPHADLITRSISELIDHSDLIVECSGDVLHATEVIDQCVRAGKPVVSMNAEFHVTAGSYFVGKGLVTEAEGDQPGCLAALREEAIEMGFKPLVYGNTKGFLNLDPTPTDMKYWAAKQGISLNQVTSFTDGTKVQIEQALVGNGLGAGILKQGLFGPHTAELQEGAMQLAAGAEQLGRPVTDYVVTKQFPGSVFLVARHEGHQQAYLQYLKLGPGPYYLLVRNYHLVHLEITKTIKRILRGGCKLLDNSAVPQYSVAAIAKRNLVPGETIARGVGGFEVRGETVEIGEQPDHLPIGLLQNAIVVRPVAQGDIVTTADVVIGESLALHAWEQIRENVLDEAIAAGLSGGHVVVRPYPPARAG